MILPPSLTRGSSSSSYLGRPDQRFYCHLANMAEAFGLAASIIGVIGFTLQLWDDTEEIRKGGSTISTADCAKQAAGLQAHCDRVKSLQNVESQLAEAVSVPLPACLGRLDLSDTVADRFNRTGSKQSLSKPMQLRKSSPVGSPSVRSRLARRDGSGTAMS